MKYEKKPWDHGPLKVSENHRYLQNGDVPFFWMGDTAWLLLPKLTLAETYIYLKNRKDKHFNVIQADCIHSLPTPDANDNNLPPDVTPEDYALIGNDFSRPNVEGSFWKHVDQVIKMAEDLGLYVALLPVWGSMVKQGHLNMDNVESYASFLANRYGSCPNIIWVMGGDTRGSDGYDVWVKMARTIKKLCPHQLMSYHPFGRTSSSLWFHEEDWLDFHMFQSGHRRYDQSTLGAWDDNAISEGVFGEDNWRYVKRDHSKDSIKPTLDAEPSYEQIPQGLHDPAEPFWQDYDVRRYAYWSVFEGACGHTYGHNAIMQFYNEKDKKGAYGAKSYWHEAIHDPGSGQMGHLYTLMCSVDFLSAKPDSDLLASPQGEKYERVSVLSGNGFAMFYDYTGRSFRVDMSKLVMPVVEAYWFDPANGVYSFIDTLKNDGLKEFLPPVKPSGHNDWVLLFTEKI